MSKNTKQIVINVQKPGINRQKYRKIVKNVEKTGKDCKNVDNMEKTVKNVQKSGKNRQKYRKIVKNVEKR